jgi:hypothetical protein
MVSPVRSRQVIELGRRLVAQLDRKDDLLASWMSHYIAELIDNAENSAPETKTAAQEACVKAILELWRRRSSWPEKVRPFAKLEPVLQTLASLDGARSNRRYYARERNDALADADEETRKWLRFADEVDSAARFLIGAAIRAATAGSAAAMTPWAELAQDAKLIETVEYDVLEFARNAYRSGDEAQVLEANLRLGVSMIEAFLQEGAAFAERLRIELDGDFSSFSLFDSLPMFSGFSLFSPLEEESDEPLLAAPLTSRRISTQ